MILRGNMFITTDMNVVINNLGTYKTIIIGDVKPSIYNQYPQLISGSCILPSYESASLMVENNIQAFDNMYIAQLASDEIHSFLAVMIKAMITGTNILLYLSNEEMQMRYAQVFIQYLNNVFGIIVGTPTNQFGYNPNYDPIILNLLYKEDLITSKELFINFPIGAIITDIVVIGKLIEEYKPYIEDNTINGYINYFNSYMQMIKNNGNTFIQQAIKTCNNESGMDI